MSACVRERDCVHARSTTTYERFLALCLTFTFAFHVPHTVPIELSLSSYLKSTGRAGVAMILLLDESEAGL